MDLHPVEPKTPEKRVQIESEEESPEYSPISKRDVLKYFLDLDFDAPDNPPHDLDMEEDSGNQQVCQLYKFLPISIDYSYLYQKL